jgi:hypothetical protein
MAGLLGHGRAQPLKRSVLQCSAPALTRHTTTSADMEGNTSGPGVSTCTDGRSSHDTWAERSTLHPLHPRHPGRIEHSLSSSRSMQSVRVSTNSAALLRTFANLLHSTIRLAAGLGSVGWCHIRESMSTSDWPELLDYHAYSLIELLLRLLRYPSLLRWSSLPPSLVQFKGRIVDITHVSSQKQRSLALRGLYSRFSRQGISVGRPLTLFRAYSASWTSQHSGSLLFD